jgi:hypothetical protein
LSSELKHSSYYNSWEYVSELKESLLSSDHMASIMEDTWQVIEQYQGSDEEAVNTPDALKMIEKCDEIVSVTPLDTFMGFLAMGRYPPPEILLAIEKCFRSYFEQAGKLELEDVFFSKPRKQRLGNNSAQASRDLIYEAFALRFELEMIRWRTNKENFGERKAGQRPTLSRVAEDFLEAKETVRLDVDSFLRGYQRWKK